MTSSTAERRAMDIRAEDLLSAVQRALETLPRDPVLDALHRLARDNPRARLRPGLSPREALRCLLTQNVLQLGEEAESKISDILAAEADPPLEFDHGALRTLGSPRLLLWRADITRLRVDAIVNAANSGGLGCFQYGHRCVDNVIHDRAGPRLRLDCRDALAGRPLDTGAVVVTAAGRLPSRFVMHTVGPIWPETTPEEADRDLARCYTACLDECASRGLYSVAFPCVSTGVFGFPNRRAADVVVRAVRAWQDTRPDVDLFVVMCVYTDLDEQIYAEYAGNEPPRIIPSDVAGAFVSDASRSAT